MYEYENTRRVCYELDEGEGTAYFVPVCSRCGRFVKADDTIKVSYRGITGEPNATCKRCGRVPMPSEGIL